MGGWLPSTKWLQGDFSGDGLADLAAAWDGGGGIAKIAVYPGSGQSYDWFRDWSQWDASGGGWNDSINWVAGDFDGDGKTDVAAAWQEQERDYTVLTMRKSTGTAFAYPQDWLKPAAGWRSSTQWCAGNFTGTPGIP